MARSNPPRFTQAKLQLHSSGQVSLRGKKPPPASSSSPGGARAPIRHVLDARANDRTRSDDGSGGSSDDEADIALEPHRHSRAQRDDENEDDDPTRGEGTSRRAKERAVTTVGSRGRRAGELPVRRRARSTIEAGNSRPNRSARKRPKATNSMDSAARHPHSVSVFDGVVVPGPTRSFRRKSDVHCPAPASSTRPVPATNPAAHRPRSVSVFEGVVIPVRPRRRATSFSPQKPNPSFTQPTPSGSTHPHPGPAAQQRTGSLTPIVVSSSDDDTDEPARSDPQSPHVQKKKRRAASSSAAASSASTRGGGDSDGLDMPESIAPDHRQHAARRERLKPTARGGESPVPAMRRKRAEDRVPTGKKRKLAALSQGRRARRSADEDSGTDVMIADDDGTVQDESSAEDEAEGGEEGYRSIGDRRRRRRGRSDRKGKDKGKGKERAWSDEESDAAEEGAARASQAKGSRGRKKKTRGRVRARQEAGRDSSATGSENDDDAADDRDEEPDDLEILDRETVQEAKFRARQDKSSRFAQLKAAREQRAAKNRTIVLGSDDEAPPSSAYQGLKRPNASAGPRYLGGESQTESSGSESSSGSGSSSSRALSDLSDDLEDFIVEEQDAANDQLVDDWRESVRGQAQGLRFYLKQYLSYLVYLIIDPQCDWLAADREWKDAHQRVHNHLTGLLDSLLSSSAWKPKFKHAVDTRPDFRLTQLRAGERGTACDACTMGKSRHSTFRAIVSGPKYDRKTLCPIDPEDDSSASSSSSELSESDSDTRTSTGRGRRTKEKTYEFALGAQCAARAEVYHELKHWAYETRLRLVERLKPVMRGQIPSREDDNNDKGGAEELSRGGGSGGGGGDEEESRRRRKEKERARTQRAREAGRLVEELERRQVIGEFATRLVQEIERAQKAFAK